MKLTNLIQTTAATAVSAAFLMASSVGAMPPLPSGSQQQSAGTNGNSSASLEGGVGDTYSNSNSYGDSYQQLTGGKAKNRSSAFQPPQNGGAPGYANTQKIDGFGIKQTQGFGVGTSTSSGTTAPGQASSEASSGGSLQQGSQWNTGVDCVVCQN